MKIKEQKRIEGILGLVLIFSLFITISYLVQKNIGIVKPFVKGYGILGILIYMAILASEVILSPISAIPLIPLISNSYGFFISFILTLSGWFSGSIIAFLIAKKFGKPLIKKLVSFEKLEKMEKLLPENQKFFMLVLIRIFIPFDILNYFFGIFTKIKFSTFSFATFLGLIPPTIFWVYLGNLPILYQGIGLIIALLLVISAWISIKVLGHNKLKNIIKCYKLVCEA